MELCAGYCDCHKKTSALSPRGVCDKWRDKKCKHGNVNTSSHAGDEGAQQQRWMVQRREATADGSHQGARDRTLLGSLRAPLPVVNNNGVNR